MRIGPPKIRHVATAAAVVLVCAGGLWWSSNRDATPANVQTDGQQAHQDGLESVDGRRYARTLDAVPVLRGRYRVSHRTTLNLPDTGHGQRVASTVLQGKLDVGEVPCDTAHRCVVMRLTDTQLQTSQAAAKMGGFAADDDKIANTQWVVDVDRTGRAHGVRVAPGSSAGMQRTVADLSFALQFVRANRGTPAQWSSTEKDTNGSYKAGYERLSNGAVTKRWRASQRWQAKGRADEPFYSATGRARFDIDSGRVAEVTVVRHGSAAVTGAAARASFDGKISLKTEGAGANDWLKAVDIAAWNSYRVVAATEDRRAYVGMYNKLVTALEDSSVRTMTDRMAIGRELTEVIRVDPAAVAAAENEIATGDKAEPVRRTVLEALAGAGTDFAQAAIGRLVSRKMAEDRRNQVLVAAAQIAHPNARLVNSVAGVAVDAKHAERGSRAAMTWGALVRARRGMVGAKTDGGGDSGDDGAKKSPDILVEAKKRLDGASLGTSDQTIPESSVDVEAKANWLEALGNTGDPKAFAPIAAALFHPREAIRIAAANALRFQDPAKAVPVMTKRMLRYDTIHVRRGILHAALWLGPAECEKLVAKALHYDRSPFVRENAAYTIAFWAEQSPGLRRHLVEALKHEDSPTVERTLRNYLEPGRVTPGMTVIPLNGGTP